MSMPIEPRADQQDGDKCPTCGHVTPKPKFCVSCRHFGQGQWRRCEHPQARGAPELVYGFRSYGKPEMMRDKNGKCGPDAKLFEPRDRAPVESHAPVYSPAKSLWLLLRDAVARR
jgi:hypothetical protein